MGGYMSYQRMRTRNNLMYRKPVDDDDPYWRTGDTRLADLHPYTQEQMTKILVGDINRMERDYLGTWPRVDTHPQSQVREGSGRCLSDEVAEKTGVDVDTVKKVLRCVFFEQL